MFSTFDAESKYMTQLLVGMKSFLISSTLQQCDSVLEIPQHHLYSFSFIISFWSIQEPLQAFLLASSGYSRTADMSLSINCMLKS